MQTANDDTDARNKDARRYSEGITADITSARLLLESYSGVPPEEVLAHIHAVVSSFALSLLPPSLPTPSLLVFSCLHSALSKKRNKAWQIYPYPCVGKFRFLDFSISSHPLYSTVVARLKDSSECLLDLGCCFGQDIRRLVADGVPGENLYGADLQPGFMELGYELFKDKDRLKSHFMVGDVFDDEGEGGIELKKLDGKIDIVHAASFFHLFSWDQQVQVGTRVVRLLNPTTKNAVLLGRHVGSSEPGTYIGCVIAGTKGRRYRHSPDSFQKMWDEIGERTGTKWKVYAELSIWEGMTTVPPTPEQPDLAEHYQRLEFAVHRVG